MHEVVIERRHQIKIGDLFGFDQLQRPHHVEARQADERAADQRHGEQRAHPHGVIERHDAERALAGAVEILRDMGQRRGAFGALAARHALRLGGGARRIEHHRPGLGIGAGLRVRRIRRHQRLERRHRREYRRRSSGACRPRPRPARPSADTRLIDQRLGLGIGEAIVELVGGRAPVQRRDDDAGELAGPMDGRRLPVVLQRRDQMVAGLQPEPVEARDQRGNPPVPLRIGEAHVAIDDGERVRVARNAGQKARAKIKHRVQASVVCVPCRPRMIHLHPMTKHEVPTHGTNAPQPVRSLAGLARPSRRPRPAGRAQAEHRAEVRTGGLCQAARRPARDHVPEARRPCDPGGVGPCLGPRLDGGGDGRRARGDAGALPGCGVASDAVAGGEIGVRRRRWFTARRWTLRNSCRCRPTTSTTAGPTSRPAS